MKSLYNFFVPCLFSKYFDQKQCAVRHLGIIIDLIKGPFIIYDWGWAGKKRGWVMRYF
jgi:hypothetical protein